MKVSDLLMLREFATTLYPRSRNDWTTPAPMPCEAPVTRTVFGLLAISASLAVGREERWQLGPCLLARHVRCVPVRPVRVALLVALLGLAAGGCRAPHRACQ